MNIQDGSAEFKIRDKRLQALIDIFYPIGTVYISADATKTEADFEFMKYGTWEKVPNAYCIETASDSTKAGSTVKAGLPNITGELALDRVGYSESSAVYAKGALSATSTTTKLPNNGASAYNLDQHPKTIEFNASKSNALYGGSTTVQPNAYFVNAWKRIK